MSKSILSIAFDVVAIGLMFVPGIGQAIGIGMQIAGLGITVAQAVGLGLMIASSVLLGPAKPKGLSASIDHNLNLTLVPTAPRKWAFGIINLAADARYQTLTGSNQDTYKLVVCHASHEVHSIDELWLDNEKAWTSSGGVQGRYVGYLTADAQRTVGTSSNGVGIDGTWGVHATLTGCAYTVWSFKLSGNSDSEQSPFQGGVTSRMTFRGHGAKTYDPRLDSSVVGGSGTQSATDQTTWVWDDNASRNPALQLLWFLLGWRINGKLAVGMGLPVARIDLPSFITAANACDEAVTLNGGGTEPRYRCDGVIGEDEDRQSVIESLCSQMNATLRDAGGKLSLYVLHNDLAAPVASFTETDILQGGTWRQTPPLTDCKNIVRGRRIDPSDTALYQPVDYPEVSLTSPDGIDRIDSVDYPFVQSNGQAQRLAKQRLERNQFQGRYEFIGGERWWQVNIGDVIQLSHQAYGWSNKLFRVVGQGIDPGGPVKMALLEENASIYQWDNNETAAVTPGAPTIYNPLNAPLLLAINQASGAVADVNRVRFSLMERGTQGYGLYDTTASSIAALDTGTTSGLNWVHTSGSFTADGQECSIGTDGPNNSNYRIPVTAGERLWVSAQVGATMPNVNCTRTLDVHFFDASNTALSTATVSTSHGSDTFPVARSGFCVAPANAVWAQIRQHATNGSLGITGAFTLKLAQPMLCSAGRFQTVGPPFNPGPGAELAAEINRWIDNPTQSLSFSYDYTGAAIDLAGGATRDVYFRLMSSAGQVTSGVSWSYTVKSGTVNGFTNASGAQSMSVTSGTGTFTVSSVGTDTVSVEITATYGISTYKYTALLKRTYTSPPSGTSGGGGTGTTTLFNKTSGFGAGFINSTTFTDVTGTLTFTSATANLSANLTFAPVVPGPGSWTVELKWQQLISGTWTDLTTPSPTVQSGVTDVYGASDGDPAGSDNATITNNKTLSGLSGTISVRCVARLTSGTKQHNISGFVNGTA